MQPCRGRYAQEKSCALNVVVSGQTVASATVCGMRVDMRVFMHSCCMLKARQRNFPLCFRCAIEISNTNLLLSNGSIAQHFNLSF